MVEAHSTSLYVPSGKGILYIAPWSGTTPPGANDYVEIGNCPSIEIEPTVERRPHYSSRSGLKTKDLDPIISMEYNINFDCDEIAAKNLAYFFLGSISGNTISAMATPDAEYALKFVADNPIGPNFTYEFWRCTIGPNGPIQLIGDDYLVLSFSASGLSDTTNHASSPYFDITYVTTTTTTTTA